MRMIALLALVAAHAVCADAASFVGAVLEFSPSFPDFGRAYTRAEAVAVMMQNINRLDKYAAQAKSQSPSAGSIVPFTEPIPALHTNPCLAPERFPGADVSVALSCMAQRHNMTIVSAYGDLMTCAPGQPPCRADGLAMYNTAVAFSDDGSIIARYHKHHLFEEPYYDVDANPTRSTFVTSFGVEFGVFICFDLIFEVLPWPASVKHFAFPTEWSNTFLPVLSAHRAQQWWSELHGAVLLASNQGQNANISGSGIWAQGTPLAQFFNPTMQPQDRLLVATVPA